MSEIYSIRDWYRHKKKENGLGDGVRNILYKRLIRKTKRKEFNKKKKSEIYSIRDWYTDSKQCDTTRLGVRNILYKRLIPLIQLQTIRTNDSQKYTL